MRREEAARGSVMSESSGRAPPNGSDRTACARCADLLAEGKAHLGLIPTIAG